jgi:hypothetical protein
MYAPSVLELPKSETIEKEVVYHSGGPLLPSKKCTI